MFSNPRETHKYGKKNSPVRRPLAQIQTLKAWTGLRVVLAAVAAAAAAVVAAVSFVQLVADRGGWVGRWKRGGEH
jgi:hypothetical protein